MITVRLFFYTYGRAYIWLLLHSWSVLPLKKAEREADAQRRPAKNERGNRAVPAKRQAVWLETQRVSN